MTESKDNVEIDNNEKIIFQIIDWDFFHNEDDDGNKKFAIRLFGRDKQQETVYVEVNDFKPYFYIEIPDNWKIKTVDTLLEEAKKKVSKEHCESITKFNIEEKCKFWGFTNYKKFKFAKLTFESFDGMKAYARALSKGYKIPSISRKWIKVKLYESNILPVLRFMHIRQLDAVGWISIDKSKLEIHDDNPTCCKQNYKTKWQNIVRIEDHSINKFVIASYDIECKSNDGSFPQPQRENDRIIQIGITLSKYGESECYERHMLSLKKTAEVDGVIVQSFNTEEELLLGFTKLLRQLDPDIITGYNIFGFDFNYMMERAKKLGISHKFERLSRVNGEQSPWVDQTLQSAALGTNLMKYYKMTGRVVIDLMKVVQRDYKLSSYKLDYVSSFFIRESITNILPIPNSTKVKILTKNTYGVNVGQYIIISYEEGAVESKYNEGEKFKIVELDKYYLIVETKDGIDTTEFMNKGYKVSWCQAKDDVSPQDIFRLADGTPEDRAIIAKYCVMDCELVSKLIAKLQIVTNSVSMAKVCNVPLSYLFLRGQGVKIFSLVAKKCREKDHLIPLIQKKEKKKEWIQNPDKKLDPLEEAKKREEEMLEKLVYRLNNKNKEDEEVEDEELSYEGAIVFPPLPGVYFEPIPVLDFSSLYPSSMIFRNLSHECFVNDPQYDNLPGYRYHTITYKVMTREDMEMTEKEKKEKEKEREISGFDDCQYVTNKFAEKIDGSKGIIPEILQDLLSARKKYKKLMESEKDPFMKSILDGLQLAYKVTANSLYGQTGASTSPICMKEIAASTTATGREMLQFSKYFIENTFAEIIDLALTNKERYYEKMNQIFKYFPTTISYLDTNRATNKQSIVHLHVCTDEKYTIPDDKFITKSIEFEEECEFDQNLKNFFLKIKKKINTTKFPEKEYSVELFANKIFEENSENRTKFVNLICNYVINSKGSTSEIFKNYKNIFKMLEINDSDELKNNLLKPLQISTKTNKNFIIELMDEFSVIIEFKNYFDKMKDENKELFDKFYSHCMEKEKQLDDIEFSNSFKTEIFNLSVFERTELLSVVSKYLIDDIGTSIKIFNMFTKFWTNLSVVSSDFLKTFILKPLKDLSEPAKDIFINNFTAIVRDSGYKGRNELFNKFYEFTNSILTGYTTKPEVIYGDSVTADEVLLLKHKETNEISITRIDKLCEKWESYNEFKTDNSIDYFVNILHQLLKPNTNQFNNSEHKPVHQFSVCDKWTSCDVDDLHILPTKQLTINNNYLMIDNIYFHKHVIENLINQLPKKIRTFFKKCDICHIDNNSLNNSKSNLKCVIENISDVDQFIDSVKKILIDDSQNIYEKEQSIANYLVWSGNEWTKINRVIRHKTNKKIYRVITNTSIVDVTEDHSLIDENGDYVKPIDCKENIKFLQSYPTDLPFNKYHNDKFDVLQFTSHDKEDLCKYYLQSKIEGYNVLINFDKNSQNFTLNRTKEPIIDSNKLILMYELSQNNNNSEYQYVYDLETENGKFHAGVGELIIKNTDSVFFRMGITDIESKEKLKDKKALAMCIKIGIWASILISTLLPKPQAQAYEKVLYPFIIQGKKRYVANLFEKDPEKFKQKSMGIELKRRDNANIVKIMCSGIIDQILNKHSAEGAYDFARETLQKVITGKFKMDKFIITKTLKGNSLTHDERIEEAKKEKQFRSYSDRSTIVHAVLADRMADRDPGNKPLSNDRIPYVYVEPKGKVDLQGDRVETPEFIIQHNLKLDYLFYITNQIKKPALKFLELLIENAEEIFREFEIKEENRKQGMMPITYYVKNSDESENNNVQTNNNMHKNNFVNFDELNCNVKIKEKKNKKQKLEKDIASKTNKTKSTTNNMTSGDLLTGLDEETTSTKKITKTSKPIKQKTKNKTITNSKPISFNDLLE